MNSTKTKQLQASKYISINDHSSLLSLVSIATGDIFASIIMRVILPDVL